MSSSEADMRVTKWPRAALSVTTHRWDCCSNTGGLSFMSRTAMVKGMVIMNDDVGKSTTKHGIARENGLGTLSVFLYVS